MAAESESGAELPPPTAAVFLPVAPLSVAPMMEVTDRHFRVFMRIITRRTTLYTEMVTDQVLARSPRADSAPRRFLPLEARRRSFGRSALPVPPS